jgi:pimeloyl-ACP methyl ester carboxylesterase
MKQFVTQAALVALCLLLSGAALSLPQPAPRVTSLPAASVQYLTEKVNGLDIFYREAGSPKNPTVVLLHGFPTSSFMFRNLIPALADRYHVIAPDYPGFGNSAAPSVGEYEYTFDNFAKVIAALLEQKRIKKYSLYVQDYGAPVGYRLFAKNPEQVQALIVQNGNAYEEGLKDFWKPLKAYWADKSESNGKALREFLKPAATKWQWTHGTHNPSTISPDTWNLDQALLDRPGNSEIQLALFFDYGSNLARYPAWQELFRRHQPPTLIVWGKNDVIFPAEGAYPYKRDLKNMQFHLLDTGHFALEEEGAAIARLMQDFLKKNVR